MCTFTGCLRRVDRKVNMRLKGGCGTRSPGYDHPLYFHPHHPSQTGSGRPSLRLFAKKPSQEVVNEEQHRWWQTDARQPQAYALNLRHASDWADSFNKFGYFASTLIKKCNIEVKLWPNNKEHLLAEYSISEYLFNMFHSRMNNALENLWRVALSSYLSLQGIFSSALKGFLHPLKNPHRQVFAPFPPSCAPFQSNSLSKSTALSTIKISKVKIWRELFKRALFCALTRDTFVSKYFWTPEK